MLQHNLEKDTITRDSFTGLLNTQQADKFISYIFEKTPLLNQVRKHTMKAESEDLEGILHTEGKTRMTGVNVSGTQGAKDIEDQSPFMRDISNYTTNIQARQYTLGYQMSKKTLREEQSRGTLGRTIAQDFAKLFHSDLENSAINSVNVDPSQNIEAAQSNATTTTATVIQVGTSQPAGFPADGTKGRGYLKVTVGGDTELITYTALVDNAGTWEFQGCGRNTMNADIGVLSIPANAASTGVAIALNVKLYWERHHLLGWQKGFLDAIKNPASGVPTSITVDGSAINSGAISYLHFDALLDNLPSKYNGYPNLTFILHKSQINNFRTWLLAHHGTAFGSNIVSDYGFAPTLGYNYIASSHVPKDTILLTNPKNLILGIRDNIEIDHVTSKTSATALYQNISIWRMTMSAGFGVERPDGCVLLEGLV